MSREDRNEEQIIAELNRLRARVAALEEERLQREREERARIILDSMYQFVGLLDLNGKILEANQTALDAAGVKRSEVIGMPFWETPWWTGSAEIQQRLKEAIAEAATGKFVRFEAEHFTDSAEKPSITVDFSLKPIRNEAGEIIYLLPEGRDITEKKLAEAELARKNEELERKNEELMQSYKKADLIFCALTDVLPGTVLDEKYRLDAKIGVGGYGAVYKATHLDLDRSVAVKVFRPEESSSSFEDLDRFRLEGIFASRVSHPNAVSVLDSGVSSEGIAYLVMELLEGHSLSSEINKKGQLSLKRCAQILFPVCNVLAEAHRHGIIHRDIKPENIFLHKTKDGEIVKVLDFGIAKLIERTTGSGAKNLTATGTIIGTPVYMSPERLENRPYDEKSDIYSLGIVAYEMLSGQVPFDSDFGGFMAVALKHIKEAPRSLGELVTSIPKSVEIAVMRALAKNPEERPDAEELARVFSAFL
jgi:PAS domain S-box-containing protein